MNEHNSALVKGLIEGRKEVLYKIYEELFPKVRKFVLRNNGRQQDAEDLFQRSLLQLITKAKVSGLPEIKSIEAYLFTINKNLWRRELNSNERVTNPTTHEQSYESGTDSTAQLMATASLQEEAVALLEQERWELYQTCFAQLTENCRKVLDFFFKKKPYSAFNEEFGYSSESVARQRVFKCKNKLSKLIKAHGNYNRLKNL